MLKSAGSHSEEQGCGIAKNYHPGRCYNGAAIDVKSKVVIGRFLADLKDHGRFAIPIRK